MPDPSRHASTATFLWNLEKIKGDKWIDFVRALAKQRPRLVESYSTVPNTIVRGEAAFGISYIQYVPQTKGPIGFAPIDQVFADPSDAAISAKAANPNAARFLIDYLCSPEGQKKVAETHEFVLVAGRFSRHQGRRSDRGQSAAPGRSKRGAAAEAAERFSPTVRGQIDVRSAGLT